MFDEELGKQSINDYLSQLFFYKINTHNNLFILKNNVYRMDRLQNIFMRLF